MTTNKDKLKVGDRYMVIEDTPDYIKMTTGDIKGIASYSVLNVKYLLKKSKVLLVHYNCNSFPRSLGVSDDKIIKAKILDVLCFPPCYKKFDSDNAFNDLYKRFLAKGFIEHGLDARGTIQIPEKIKEASVIELNNNLLYILDDVNKLFNRHVSGLSKNIDVLYKVPNTRIFIGGHLYLR